MEPDEFFAGRPIALGVFVAVRDALFALGPLEVRTSRSQVAFRRARGFAYLWLPDQFLKRPGAPVVLSIALGRHDESTRFKEVVHPSPRHWMHHLEINDPSEVDAEVLSWLAEAAERSI